MCCSECCEYRYMSDEDTDDSRKMLLSLLKEMDEAFIEGTLPDSLDEVRMSYAKKLGLYDFHYSKI